jgi:hypothetical protein
VGDDAYLIMWDAQTDIDSINSMLVLFCGMLKLTLTQLIRCLSYSVNFNIFYHNMFFRSNARAFT